MLQALVDSDPQPESVMVPPKCVFECKPRQDLWHSVVAGQDPASEVRCFLHCFLQKHDMITNRARTCGTPSLLAKTLPLRCAALLLATKGNESYPFVIIL